MTVNDFYLPFEERIADEQYRRNLQFIMEKGEDVENTPQDVSARTYIHPPSMRFKISNGAPLITERAIPFWRSAIGEMCGFLNGITEHSILKNEFGCPWWEEWVTESKCRKINVPTGNLGPASYAGAWHDFPMPNNETFNQIDHIINQLKKYPHIRTHHISPWIPFWNGRGGFRKAVVTPCHGWIFYRIINNKLSMMMVQRSADFPVGVPADMIQYWALLLMTSHVTGYIPYEFIHVFFDAHIYTNQFDSIKEMLHRVPRKLPTLKLTNDGLCIKNIFDFRPKHFSISDYDPHPAVKGIPVAI